MFFNIDRPAERVNFLNTFAGNIFLALFTGAVLLAARIIPLDRFAPGFCVFRKLTGFPCPTCGFTRAFCAFANGNWEQGVINCPFALLLFVLTALAFIYNAAVLIAGIFGFQIRRGSILSLSPAKWKLMAIFSLLLLLANWAYRLALGFG